MLSVASPAPRSLPTVLFVLLFAVSSATARAGTAALALGSMGVERTSQHDARQKSPLRAKLNRIVIPEMQFEEMPIDNIMQFLRRRSRDLDRSGDGVNILVKLPEAERQRTVTMDLSDLPVGDIIRYVCMAANVSYRIDPSVVVILPRSQTPDLMETRFYSLDVGWVFARGDRMDDKEMREFFESKGITFPEGARIGYYQRQSKLAVTNTAENLRRVERMMNELHGEKDR